MDHHRAPVAQCLAQTQYIVGMLYFLVDKKIKRKK